MGTEAGIGLPGRVRGLLRSRQLSLREAADLCGVSDKTIGRLARGTQIPRRDTWEKIAQGLEVGDHDLFRRLPGEALWASSDEEEGGQPRKGARQLDTQEQRELHRLLGSMCMGNVPLLAEEIGLSKSCVRNVINGVGRPERPTIAKVRAAIDRLQRKELEAVVGKIESRGGQLFEPRLIPEHTEVPVQVEVDEHPTRPVPSSGLISAATTSIREVIDALLEMSLRLSGESNQLVGLANDLEALSKHDDISALQEQMNAMQAAIDQIAGKKRI